MAVHARDREAVRFGDPNDFPTATAAAMHKLADLAANNGGDWEKAVAQYGTFLNRPRRR